MYETDVLVIGAGGAGLRAALEAKAYGKKVLLTAKKGGNSSIQTVGAHCAVMDVPGTSDSQEQHFEDTMNSGHWISSPELVEILVSKAPAAIKELESWGVEFLKDKTDNYLLMKAGGHSFPRTIRCKDGYHQLYKVMLNKIKQAGIQIFHNFLVIKILSDQQKVWGAVGINSLGELVIIKAKAVILAAGGLGQIFKNTTNPTGISGDGYVLAHDAGAKLIDMEFIQFLPTCMTHPKEFSGMVVNDTLRGEGAKLLNVKGERFMEKYSPQKMELATRDVIARAIYQEIKEGNGTAHQGVYLDASELSEEQIFNSFPLAKRLHSRGINLTKEYIEVAPFVHFYCGGVKIDTNCFTGIEGLWVCGETAGGIHGANRLGGNALSEILVFGKIAGENAARQASSSMDSIPDLLLKEVKMLEELLDDNPFHEHINEHLSTFKDEIKTIMWDSVGIVRNKKMMEHGFQRLEEIRKELSKLQENNALGKSVPLFMTVRNMALLGGIILQAALKRKESIGTHYRDDG